VTLRHWDDFPAKWVADYEFTAPPGHRPVPICVVAHEVHTGTTIRLGPDDLAHCPAPPFGTGPDELVVAYYATAEIGCYLAQGWPLPRHLLDLYAEYRWLTNDGTARDRSLLGASAFFRLRVMEVVEKSEMRQLAIRGGPYTPTECQALIAYCEADVRATTALFARMRPLIELPCALLRGRSMAAFARIEHVGVPIDVPRLQQLQAAWNDVKPQLIARVDRDYHVFDGTTFKANLFERYLATRGMSWPLLDSGALDLKDQTFRDQSKAYPQLHPLRELRSSLSELRLGALAVGPDGRNRVLLSPFGSKTGRCTPSTTAFVFGPSTWIRALIRPGPGMGLAYVDWSHQELGIAAALSRDAALQAAYASGDPYLAFAIRAGAAPSDATKLTHGATRELFKTCSLGLQYGMGPESLAVRIHQPPVYAARLIRQHQETYRQFWKWSGAVQSYALARGHLTSVFGWRLLVTPETRVRTLANFPMQANGAEMLRLAAVFLTEAGVRVCAPVHDAVLIEAPLAALEDAVQLTQQLMEDASAIVLDGFRLRTEAALVRYPDRYDDPRGRAMWETLNALVPPLAVTDADVRCADA
jgi:DNA polymerase I